MKHSCTETHGYTVIIGPPNSNLIKGPMQQVLKQLVWTRTTDDSFTEENQTTQSMWQTTAGTYENVRRGEETDWCGLLSLRTDQSSNLLK